MKSSRKASIAMELVRNPDQTELISRVTSIQTNSLHGLRAKLEKGAFAIFTASPLEIAISSTASRVDGGKVKVVQVGANDGRDQMNPLIHRYASSALLIEPIHQLANEIQKNYIAFKGELSIVNCAICDEAAGAREDFCINMLDEKYWDKYISNVGRSPTEISSVYEGGLIKKISQRLNISEDDAKKAIVRISCGKRTLSSVLEECGFNDVDVLQVDAEGYDFNIIKSLGAIRPSVINFESNKLGKQVWGEWKVWAKDNGYGWIQGHTDTLAIKGAAFEFEY